MTPFRQLVHVLILVVPLSACVGAKRAKVRVEPGAAVERYTTFRILPVRYEGTDSVGIRIAALITIRLRAELSRRGLTLTEDTLPSSDTAVLKSSLAAHAPSNIVSALIIPGSGAGQCILASELLDGNSGKSLAHFVSVQTGVGGRLAAHEMCAYSVAEALVKLVPVTRAAARSRP